MVHYRHWRLYWAMRHGVCSPRTLYVLRNTLSIQLVVESNWSDVIREVPVAAAMVVGLLCIMLAPATPSLTLFSSGTFISWWFRYGRGYNRGQLLDLLVHHRNIASYQQLSTNKKPTVHGWLWWIYCISSQFGGWKFYCWYGKKWISGTWASVHSLGACAGGFVPLLLPNILCGCKPRLDKVQEY